MGDDVIEPAPNEPRDPGLRARPPIESTALEPTPTVAVARCSSGEPTGSGARP